MENAAKKLERQVVEKKPQRHCCLSQAFESGSTPLLPKMKAKVFIIALANCDNDKSIDLLHDWRIS